MRRLRALIALAIASLALAALPQVGSAHRTGNEQRTVAACQELTDPTLKRECIACVRRPVPHHFHANFPAGRRCRPDNGQP